mgnify:CR=1 FL=1
MTKNINWGIIGVGKIAEKFASDLALSENAVLSACASRSFEKSKKIKDFDRNKNLEQLRNTLGNPFFLWLPIQNRCVLEWLV